MQATRDDTGTVTLSLTAHEASQLLRSLSLAMTHASTVEHEQFALGLSVELRCAGVERELAAREVLASE